MLFDYIGVFGHTQKWLGIDLMEEMYLKEGELDKNTYVEKIDRSIGLPPDHLFMRRQRGRQQKTLKYKMQYLLEVL